MARYVYRRSMWRVFWKICAAFCGLYLVLAALEWAFESAPYVVMGALSMAVLGMFLRGTR